MNKTFRILAFDTYTGNRTLMHDVYNSLTDARIFAEKMNNAHKKSHVTYIAINNSSMLPKKETQYNAE